MNDDIDLYLNSLNVGDSVRADLHYKLTDIKNRGVKPHLVESYCKSLGWALSVSQAWEDFNMWMAEREAEGDKEPALAEAEQDRVDSTEVARALLSKLFNDLTGDVFSEDTPLEEMYGSVVNVYKSIHSEAGELEAELTELRKVTDSSADVSYALHNLMAGFLLKAGYSADTISDLALDEKSSIIEDCMGLVGAVTAMAADKIGRG